MSDNVKRFRAVRQKLNTVYPIQPRGNLARHLDTMAGLVSGIVGSRSVNLPHVASAVPDGNKEASREKRFSRWLNNKKIDFEQYFLPFVKILLINLTGDTLIFAIDGSVVGRGCVTLMINVIFQGRSLPVVWIVAKGKKGHFPEDMHIDLVTTLKSMIPECKSVVFLGDGEFDGIGLQATIEGFHWKYVCRTAKNTKLFDDRCEFQFEEAIAGLAPGEYVEINNILFTNKKYKLTKAICYWGEGFKEPIFLVTNVKSADKACDLYAMRFRIETFFSDQKSRGFNLHKSHISNPERVSRLLLASCLAYIWIIYLGVKAKKDGWMGIIHRTKRCDLSLFQLGLKLLNHVMNEGLAIPVAFAV